LGGGGGKRRLTAAVIRRAILGGFEAANEEVFESSASDDSRFGMATTMIACVVAGERLCVGHVGDSRMYRFGPDGLRAVTTDHSLVAELIGEGAITEEEAFSHPKRNVVTRTVGGMPYVEADYLELTPHGGETLLLVTDGVTDMLRESEVERILMDCGGLGEACDRLVEAANERGGADNITVVALRV